MRYVEGQQVGYTVNVTDRHQPSVVNLLADDTHCCHQGLPGWENVRRLHQEREGGLKGSRLGFCLHSRQAQAVRSFRPGRHVTEFNQVLRRDL